ncbi:MAG TPA: rhamnulokinase [Candidatus Dwaynia gallinarum]|nr:rhamnulokinase [Candidatus Dwaynia gallinarum]
MKCCLVIDISKINLKIISVVLREDKIFMQEIHRCSKILIRNKDSKLSLNIDKIIKEINEALVSVKQIGYNVESISVNSSINEFVLLDEHDNLVRDIFVEYSLNSNYLNKIINELGMAYIYRKTGISFNLNNALYKLMMYRDLYPEDFLKVRKILSFSDYINYRLTGEIFHERAQLSLTQIFNFKNQDIDEDILNYLDLKDRLEFNLVDYGKSVGKCKINGVEVIAPYGNNLLSSFLTTDVTNKNSIFIVNSYEGIIGCTENFSKMYLEGIKFDLNHQLFNEELVKIFKYIPCYRLVDDFLKNVENNYMIENAWNVMNNNEFIDYIIDFDSDIFRNSAALINTVKYYFEFKLNSLPDSISNFIRIVYDSFAVYYKKCIKDLEKITGGIFDSVCMVGDYSINNSYNQFIADIILKDLEVGPKESGIIGNAINQFISLGKIKNISYAYEILKNSFNYLKIKYSGKKINYKYFENIV